MNILGLSGSLRRASYNTALLRAAQRLLRDGAKLQLATCHGVPPYDADMEAVAVPEAVTALKEQLFAADALLIASPEYNNGIPGVLKNTIDWLSRPPKDVRHLFGGLPVGLIGASTGKGGTRLSQAAWLPVLRALGCQLFASKMLFVSAASTSFDAEGELTDVALRERLSAYLQSFVSMVERCGGRSR